MTEVVYTRQDHRPEGERKFSMRCKYGDGDGISAIYYAPCDEVTLTVWDEDQMASVALPMRLLMLNLFSIMPHYTQDNLVRELVKQRGLT